MLSPRRRSAAAAVAALGLLVPVSGALADDLVGTGIAFSAPTELGVTGLSERVAYSLTGSCEALDVAVVLLTAGAAVPGDESGAGGSPVVRGEAARGCDGTVTVPDDAALAEAGLTEADVVGAALVARSGDTVEAERALRLERLQAEHAEVVSGTAETVERHDARGVALTGDSAAVSLGTVDLTRLHSLSFTYATDADGSMVCFPFGYDGPQCVAGNVVVTAGEVGPVVATGDLLHKPDEWERIVTPLVHKPAGPVELFARFDAVPPAHCGPATTPTTPMGQCSDGTPLVVLDSVDFNGRGVSELYEAPADPEGTVQLFDGSLDGWTATGGGTGAFTVDGDELVVRGGFGQLYHEGTFGDYELRLDFKVDSTVANSGVHLRFPGSVETEGYEVQVQDYGFNYPGSRDYGQTGSIYQQVASDRIATNDVGEWNTYQIRVVGQEYTVTLNGREITRFTGSKGLEGHIGLQTHDPSSEIRYRDIRVVPVA